MATNALSVSPWRLRLRRRIGATAAAPRQGSERKLRAFIRGSRQENTMNSPNVLIAYGTKNGSTAAIADMIASTLRAEGLRADVRPAAQVRNLVGFDAVVLGGALYANRWHRDARQFVRRNAKAVTGRPVWLFNSGPLDASADGNDIGPVPQAADAVRRLAALEHVTFGGRLSDAAGGFIARAMARNGRGGDFRNSDRIAAWSRAIAHQLLAGRRTPNAA